MSSCAFPKWYVGNCLRDILLADVELTEMVGSDIYPIVAPEGTEDDFILYQRQNYNRERAHMGVYEDECVIMLRIVSGNYDRALAIAEIADDLLEGKHECGGYKFTVELSDSSEDFVDNKYVQILNYRIK